MQRLKSRWLIFVGIALLAAIPALITGSWLVFVTAALGLGVALQLWLATQLRRALVSKRRERPFEAAGLWRDIFAAVHRLQQRNRKRKRRLSRFVSRFQQAAAAVPDAIVILGRDGRIEWRNRAAKELLGLRSRTSLHVPIVSLIREPVFVQYMSDGDFSRALEMAAPLDRSVMLSVRVIPFGRRKQRLLVARDVSHSYYLDAAQKDFVANVSHDLRTPLTILLGNLELLQERTAELPDVSRSVTTMQANAERMRALIEDLLALSRLQMDQRKRIREPVDVCELIGLVVAEAQALAADTRHVLTVESDTDLMIWGNAKDLRSAVANLVQNAIRHTPPRTQIEVRWYRLGDAARLRVSDNGPGIAQRHIPRLTERFYRVDESRSGPTGGTGLGLSIVKSVLEWHAASLSVQSREGAGSVFECQFPASEIVDAAASDTLVATRD